MIHIEPHPLAGQMVTLGNGRRVRVEDWADRALRGSWLASPAKVAAEYRDWLADVDTVPRDDEVLYVTQHGEAGLVHTTRLAAPVPRAEPASDKLASQQVEDLREVLRIIFEALDLPIAVWEDRDKELHALTSRIAHARGITHRLRAAEPLDEYALTPGTLEILRSIATETPVTYRSGAPARGTTRVQHDRDVADLNALDQADELGLGDRELDDDGPGGGSHVTQLAVIHLTDPPAGDPAAGPVSSGAPHAPAPHPSGE